MGIDLTGIFLQALCDAIVEQAEGVSHLAMDAKLETDLGHENSLLDMIWAGSLSVSHSALFDDAVRGVRSAPSHFLPVASAMIGGGFRGGSEGTGGVLSRRRA